MPVIEVSEMRKKTKIISIKKDRPEQKKLEEVSRVLCNGGVIVFPTDTVYGLAAGAFHIEAQKKIYELKGRPYKKPLILMSYDIKSLEFLVKISDDARKLMKKFWPGPLTIVLPTTRLGKLVMGGRNDIAVRIPQGHTILSLLKIFGSPIATTSANPSSKSSIKKGQDAVKMFKGKTDVVLNAGECNIGKESTVIDMIKFPYVVVREGCLSSKKLLNYL
ncbi:L-threonylcarbamoyladenylate synthase [Elusimicrobiota bacterium]